MLSCYLLYKLVRIALHRIISVLRIKFIACKLCPINALVLTKPSLEILPVGIGHHFADLDRQLWIFNKLYPITVFDSFIKLGLFREVIIYALLPHSCQRHTEVPQLGSDPCVYAYACILCGVICPTLNKLHKSFVGVMLIGRSRK